MDILCPAIAEVIVGVGRARGHGLARDSLFSEESLHKQCSLGWHKGIPTPDCPPNVCLNANANADRHLIMKPHDQPTIRNSAYGTTACLTPPAVLE